MFAIRCIARPFVRTAYQLTVSVSKPSGAVISPLTETQSCVFGSSSLDHAEVFENELP